jgi:hypothetical protein
MENSTRDRSRVFRVVHPSIHPSIHPSSRFGGSSVRSIAFRLVSPRPLKLVVVIVIAKTSRHRRHRRLATVAAVGTASRTNAVASRAAPRNSQQSTTGRRRDATRRECTKQLYRKKINDEHDARETRAHAPHRANPSPPSSDARAHIDMTPGRCPSRSLGPSVPPSLPRSVDGLKKYPIAVHSQLFTHTRVFHKISRESVDSHRKRTKPRIRSRPRHHSTYVYVLCHPIRSEPNGTAFGFFGSTSTTTTSTELHLYT